jgi:hypothetical protein
MYIYIDIYIYMYNATCKYMRERNHLCKILINSFLIHRFTSGFTDPHVRLLCPSCPHTVHFFCRLFAGGISLPLLLSLLLLSVARADLILRSWAISGHVRMLWPKVPHTCDESNNSEIEATITVKRKQE